MIENQNEKVFVRRESVVTYIQKNALFGLIRWYKKLNAESLRDDIFIILDSPVRKIVVVRGDKEDIFKLE